MFNRFKLKGNVSGAIRSDEELASIDKRAADETFKIQKKRLDAFFQQKEFVKYKANSYLRRNQLNVLEYIDLQKEHYGSRTFTVNYALISLYVPHSFLSFDLGDRLGKLLEITYRSENIDSVIASVSEELSRDYDILTETYELENAGTCTAIDTRASLNGANELMSV